MTGSHLLPHSSSSCHTWLVVVSKEEFVTAVTELAYAPPLGGPYVAASSATIDDTRLVEALFDLLSGEKEKLTKHRMGLSLRQLSGGEQGLSWNLFAAAVGAEG